MNPALNQLIQDFRETQDAAVTLLTERLGVPRPLSAEAWIDYFMDEEHRLSRCGKLESVRGCIHGNGIKMWFDDRVIDFDWGMHGEPDGFDAWRLWCFREDNHLPILCTHDLIISWLENARESNEVVRINGLYYDPTRRRR